MWCAAVAGTKFKTTQLLNPVLGEKTECIFGLPAESCVDYVYPFSRAAQYWSVESLSWLTPSYVTRSGLPVLFSYCPTLATGSCVPKHDPESRLKFVPKAGGGRGPWGALSYHQSS